MLKWLHDLSELLKGGTSPSMCKTLRHSGGGKSPHRQLHLVSAWAADANLTLGVAMISLDFSSRRPGPILLELLQAKGTLVSIDAMGCQQEIAKRIVEPGAD